MSAADADAAINTAGSVLYYVQNQYRPTEASVHAFAACLTS
jgi:hypothetical protein